MVFQPLVGANKRRSSVSTAFVKKASRLHYELRLEVEGVFRSWAVPRSPSLDSLEKRLSTGVEDHPLSYGAFEGTIPKANYGAGTVILWDAGTYEMFETLLEETHEKTFLRQYGKGNLKLRFHGKKMEGDFALVQLKASSTGKDWLLIKKTRRACDVGGYSVKRCVGENRPLS